MTNRLKYFIPVVVVALAEFQTIRLLLFHTSRTTEDNFDNVWPSSLTEGCLTSHCIDIQATALARVFPDRSDQEWCVSKRNANQATHDGGTSGLILVKVPKAASSTSAGVAFRIANRLHCDAVHWEHQPGTRYADRDEKRSYAFMTVRDPGARAVSRIFFDVSRLPDGAPSLTDEFLLHRLENSTGFQYGSRSNGQGGFQLRYAAPRSIPEHSMWNASKKSQVQNHNLVIQTVKSVLEHYDFVLVTERMDESLVAMALRMGIEVGDVLVTASKVSGSRFHLIRDHVPPKCQAIRKSYVSPAVEAYLASDDWRAANYGDYVLHQAANASLDKTIEAIGRDQFDMAMLEYRRLRAMEETECAPYVQFPCTNSGRPQPKIAKTSCYLKDFGCGHKCIDEIIKRRGKNSSLALNP